MTGCTDEEIAAYASQNNINLTPQVVNSIQNSQKPKPNTGNANGINNANAVGNPHNAVVNPNNDPAPITLFSPIFIFPTITQFAYIVTLSPISGYPLLPAPHVTC